MTTLRTGMLAKKRVTATTGAVAKYVEEMWED
jgi:hypothetical protein